jgi:outer membrane receptor protein involved in Fe transport
MGQGKVTGVVVDATTGEPLAGAQVYLEGTGIGVLTRDNGRYFLLNVPPGTYTIVAELIGYSTTRRENVLVAIEVTRVVNFELTPSAVAVEELVVEVEQAPLIETSATGSSSVVTAGYIDALPVSSTAEVLALQHGFLEVPQNTDVISYLDTRRGITPIRIRGGRAGETLTLVDGIPINNFLLGGPAMYLSNMVIEQLDYVRGGFPPKYGNALSGIINIKTREPGTEIRGSIRYQTSSVAGSLGNKYADLLNYDQIEGYVAGPIPGTKNNLRFVVSGRNWNRANRVLEFDNDVMNPVQLTRDERGNFGSVYDLIPGWRAIGFDDRRDIFGKLVYYFTPTAKLALTAIDYQRQTKPYDFRWLQAGFDLYGQCAQLYPELEDVCNRTYLEGIKPEKMEDLRRTRQENQWMNSNSIEQRRTLWALNWDHTLGRMAYTVALGGFDQERETCVFLSGICLGSRIASNWRNGPFESSGGDKNFGKHPIFGTDDTFGGDKVQSFFFRADGQWQATDHHNLAAGVFYQKHDVEFTEGVDVGLNAVQIEWNRYAGEPWDAAVYLQDRIEYDFITVDLGFRIDYGQASGLFFADPRDPTNGTTAFEVCQEPTSFGLPGNKFTYTDPQTGETFTGITACAKDATLMGEAVTVAMQDDFVEAKARSQFSPRLGISFPVTASSSLFFNYGRFSQNPLLHNLYRMTNIGMYDCNGDVTANPTGPDCKLIEGSRQALGTVVNAIRTPLLGNPNLVTEATSSYEFGFLSEIGEDYALSAILFSKDQYGLTGLRRGGVDATGTRVFDAGSTYGTSTFDYQVLLNLDYQTARGFEISLMRRLTDFWGFDLRYSYSRVRTNAAAPELELQKREEADDMVREEIISEIDQPHVLNGVLRFQTGDESPLGAWLRNTMATVVLRMASGLPFTPILDEEGDNIRLERNSGRGPMTWRVDLLLQKNFEFRGVYYGLFFRVTNLFNTTNCIQVFSSTGNCDSGAITESRLRRGGIAQLNTISQAWDRADYLSEPRWASFGVRVSF